MYKYGLKTRGFGIGCQPKGFVKAEDTNDSKYYSYVWYNEKLEEGLVQKFEMELVQEGEKA